MGDIVEKQSDTVIKVTKTIPEKQEIVTYDIDFLKSQKIAIENDIARNQAALAEVNALIAQAEAVGVISVAVEEPIV